MAGEFALHVQGLYDGAPIVVAPLIARDHPHNFELVAIGIFGVEGLRRAVIALADEGPKFSEGDAGGGEVFEAWDLPGEVIEADAARPGRRGVGADFEQAEVVVVGGAGGAEKGHAAALAGDLLEGEGGAIESDRPFEIANVEDRMVEADDGNGSRHRTILLRMPWRRAGRRNLLTWSKILDMDENTEAFCPHYHHAIELIGRRWTGAIVRAMLRGKTRFSDITSAIPGLSDRLLSERLKELEAEGIVERRVYPETPVRIEYVLTEKGRALERAVTAVADWAESWLAGERVHA